MNLYDIKAEIADAIESMFDSVNPETGEIDAGTVERLESLQAERAAKLDGIGAYLKNLDSDIDAIDAEIKTLQARKKVKENKKERLKTYTADFLASEITADNPKPRFESARVVLSLRSSESVNIIDESKLSKIYFKTKTETVPDVAAIRQALKAGKTVKGAEMVTKNNLQIK